MFKWIIITNCKNYFAENHYNFRYPKQLIMLILKNMASNLYISEPKSGITYCKKKKKLTTLAAFKTKTKP